MIFQLEVEEWLESSQSEEKGVKKMEEHMSSPQGREELGWLEKLKDHWGWGTARWKIVRSPDGALGTTMRAVVDIILCATDDQWRVLSMEVFWVDLHFKKIILIVEVIILKGSWRISPLPGRLMPQTNQTKGGALDENSGSRDGGKWTESIYILE